MTTRPGPARTAPLLPITPALLQEFTPLAESVVRLVALLDDPTIPLLQVAHVAEHDVALTSHILRLANSALYGAPHHIGTIADAVRTIGLDQVRLLVVSGSMGRLRQRALPCYGLPVAAFSRHSELVAALALFLAREIGYADPGVAYTAGLLHDVGKVAVDQLGQQARWDQTPMNQAARRGVFPMHDAEQAFCGQTHAQVGERLAALWALPDEIAAAIAAHHTFEGGPDDAPLAWCVAVANRVAGAHDPDYLATQRPAPALTVDPAVAAAADALAQQVLQAPEEEMSDWAIVQAMRARQRARTRGEEGPAPPAQPPATCRERGDAVAPRPWSPSRLGLVIVGGILLVVLVALAATRVVQ